jgi:hypothetical protein
MENNIREHKRQKIDTEINNIIKNIRDYKYNNNIDILIKTLEELYKYNKHMIAIDAADGIKAIVYTMNTHKDNVKVLIAGLLVLSNFTDINDIFMSEYKAFTYTDKIIDSGVILCIIRAMETHIEQFDFMIIACDIIAKLSTYKNILNTDGLLAIVETIRFSNNTNQIKVLIAACNALCIFSEYKKISESTDALDYIDCICNVINKNPTYNEVLIYATKTLLNLVTANDMNKNRAIRAKAIYYITRVMENNIIITDINTKIILYSCMIINSLSSQYTKLCMKVPIAIMKANPKHEEIQLYLSLMIYKITLLKKFCIHNEIVKENGIEVFIANIKKYTDNTKIVEYTCTILYFLLTIPSNNTMHESVINKILEDIKSQIITSDCITYIFKAINIYVKNENTNNHTMIEAALLFLRKLCSSQTNNILIMKADYINIIIATINKYKKNESFVIYCLNFLKYMYCDFPTIKIQDDPIQSKDIEILFSVIKLYINNTHIIVITCSILSRWYELNPVNLPQDTTNCEQLEILFLNNEYFTKLIGDPIYNIKNITANIESIEVIFEAMGKHRNNINVMTVCNLILAQYIHIKGNLAVVKVVNMRGVQIAIENLKIHFEKKIIRSSVCFLLGTLCKIPNTPYLTKSNKAIQQDIFKAGGIKYAMMSLRHKTNDTMELNNASLLLASISLDNENGEIVTEIINHGGFKVILGAMTITKQKNRVILAYHICCLIINILIANINHNDSMKFAKEGGIEVVIQIMKDFKNDRGLCNPLKLLCLVSKNKDLLMSIATAIGTEDGFSFLLEFINIRTEDKYDNMVHEHTTEILNNLAKEQYILNKMKDDKVLEWIENIIKNNINIKNETYQRYKDLISILRV